MIKQEFKNKPAILIATGPSLTEEVVETIRKYKNDYVIFGCNDSYQLVDFLDIHYACDARWWSHHIEQINSLRPGLRSWTQHEETSIQYDLNLISGKYEKGLSLSSDLIHYGSNSGYQLLNLALLFGCNKFILVGYNMRAVQGKSHFFGEHPQKIRSTSPYNKFVEAYRQIQSEFKPHIVNCTPDSALTMFRNNNLEDELCE